ncbi:hypothetical protein RUM4293_00123 [Ruegeria atlantica]|uniref:Uncharacterized protein n=1 Tax=Ruegeria atlantica TaxID=81569 RepID=A0A0P1EJV8_9RHOB|nr:hypothetical protein RUM4293_00123 [Ruegeria atlantica]
MWKPIIFAFLIVVTGAAAAMSHEVLSDEFELVSARQA